MGGVLVSIIIPTFNRKHCLARALNSVLVQSYLDFEVLVIDDGSTDGTGLMIATDYPAVRYQYQCNQGVSAARNHGLKLAQGRYMAFLDSDDAWQSDKLSMQIHALTMQPNYRVCHTNEIWYRKGVRVNEKQKHKKQGGWIFEACLPLCCISPSSIVLEKSLLDEIGWFDESLPACEDYDLWLRLCAKVPVLYLEEGLTLKYGGHADQLSTRYWGMDRFRIQALVKLLTGGHLKEQDESAAVSMLHQKIDIYLQGARKRGKHDEVDYYESIKQQFKCTTD